MASEKSSFGGISDLHGKLLFALPKKGRLAEHALKLVEGADIQFYRKNRLDIAIATNFPLALLFLPAADIAKFVGEGNVDLGITGQDMVAEAGVEVNELMQLGFGKCRLCVQVPVDSGITDPKQLVGRRVVTSFTTMATNFFEKLDKEVGTETPTHIEYVSGSVEAACALGLADGIVDLVESGDTMRAAGLTAIHTILTSQAVLISKPKSQGGQSAVDDGRMPQADKLALVDRIANRIRGVWNANRYVQCTYNAPREKIKECAKITPGNKAPTIMPLDDYDWVSMSAMVLKSDAAEIMDRLEAVGAKDILLFSMSNCRLQS
ncbi:HisG-domain-containing protein [Hyaloraphidium curvatum]|nr:HisG-domain-containing protein [Hyaloraphidium curvatum]